MKENDIGTQALKAASGKLFLKNGITRFVNGLEEVDLTLRGRLKSPMDAGSAGILPAVVCILLTTFDNSPRSAISSGTGLLMHALGRKGSGGNLK